MRIFPRQSGQTLVEVALAAPLLLALLLGSIEMGRYAYIAIVVGNAARAGAAYGSVGLTQSVDTIGIQAAADNDFRQNGQSVTNLNVASSTSCGCDNNGQFTSAFCTTSANPTAGACLAGQWVVLVSVTASGTFNSLFSYPWIPSSVTVSRTVTLRVNQFGG